MNTDSIEFPLVLAAGAFAAFMVWRFRPVLGPEAPPISPGLKEAQKRAEVASSNAEKAMALCDAGDACGNRIGRGESAASYYLRAMRVAPESVEVVDRAARGLARRPRTLENLLWRRLGAEPWQANHSAAIRRTLEHLARVYAGPLRQPSRSKAMESAAGLLKADERS